MKSFFKKMYRNIKNFYYNICTQTDWTYCSMIILVLFGYVLLHDILGEKLLEHNIWDSYTLQAKAWLDGHTYLDKNYTHLELAIYKGHFYVSFPPLPSVLLIPWVLLYGVKTPNNFIMIIYILMAVTLVYVIAKHFKMRSVIAAFWAIVVVFGSNMLWMSTMGGVWFQAQLLNMVFCLAAIYVMLNNKRIISYLCIAFAVGCRPFSIVYFFVLLIYYYNLDKKKNNSDSWISIIIRQWKEILSAAIVGILYMTYNFIRFDNPLEFGHNYLPEFIESKNGQFNVSYIITNLLRIFFGKIRINKNLGLEFTKFDGFIIFIANPIFIIYICYIIKNIIKKKNNNMTIVIAIMTMCNMLLLCLHKTMGGWQFGNRYLVDLIPFILLFILITKQRENRINKLAYWERFVGVFAVMINVYGAIIMRDLK